MPKFQSDLEKTIEEFLREKMNRMSDEEKSELEKKWSGDMRYKIRDFERDLDRYIEEIYTGVMDELKEAKIEPDKYEIKSLMEKINNRYIYWLT